MHMNLKKYATLLLAASLTLSGFCGCAATKADSQQLPLKTAVYSNLTDEESRSLLRQGLSDAGVKENRIDTLFARALKERHQLNPNLIPMKGRMLG